MPQPLTPQQRRGLAQATAAGTQGQYLAAHPGVAQHQQRVAAAPPTGAPATGAGGNKGGAGGAAQPLGRARPLTPQQQRQLAAAQTGGTEAQYLAAHPGVAKHQQKIGATPAGAAPGPAAGAPGAGAGGQKAGPPPGPAPAPGAPAPAPAPPGAGTPAAPTAPMTFNEAFNKQFGAGAANQFQQNWYGDNPLTTAMEAAKRTAGGQLADIRNRYAQSGFGTSGREALAEGQAIGDINTNLGAQLAQLGTQVRGSDLDRLSQMFATAGAQQLQERLGMGQLGLQANQMLANLGTGITGVGAQEQGIPNMENIIAILANMSQQPTFSQGAQKPSK